MRISIKPVFLIASILITLYACSSPDTQRKEAIKTLLTSKVENWVDCEMLNESYDSIYSTERNIDYINTIQDLIILRDSTLQMLKHFKSKHTDTNSRIWLKNINGEARLAYDSILTIEERMSTMISDFALNLNSDKMIGKPYQSIVLKFTANDIPQYGLFVFNEKNEITRYKIFSEREYNAINDFINVARENAIKYIPNFEDFGIDIVPEDEDPSKNKAEREQIKAEKEAKQDMAYRSYMKRTNPIPDTFYGAILGKTTVKVILRKLKKEGWKVTQLCNYSYSEYYCSNWREYKDGMSYNVIRIYAQDGIFDKIIFIDDYTPEWDAKKRYYGSEVKDAFHRAKSSARKKYGYWSQNYEDTEFDDGSTILTVQSDEVYSVEYIFAKKKEGNN